MKSLLFLLLLVLVSLNLNAQENYLKTGFYRVAEEDSCLNSDNYIMLSDSEAGYCIYKIPIVTENNFESVKINADTAAYGINYTVWIKLDSSGADSVKEATEKMVGQKAAFIINNKVIAAPVVRDPIVSGSIAVFCDEKTVDEVRKVLRIK